MSDENERMRDVWMRHKLAELVAGLTVTANGGASMGGSQYSTGVGGGGVLGIDIPIGGGYQAGGHIKGQAAKTWIDAPELKRADPLRTSITGAGGYLALPDGGQVAADYSTRRLPENPAKKDTTYMVRYGRRF